MWMGFRPAAIIAAARNSVSSPIEALAVPRAIDGAPSHDPIKIMSASRLKIIAVSGCGLYRLSPVRTCSLLAGPVAFERLRLERTV
jgi:hypothetical protein